MSEKEGENKKSRHVQLFYRDIVISLLSLTFATMVINDKSDITIENNGKTLPQKEKSPGRDMHNNRF